MEKVICNNRECSWGIENDDNRPYLCHKCGYDNQLNQFDMIAFNKWKKENPNIKLPFKEEQIAENTFIREFNHDTESGELTWHRDREDRIIESLGDTDWKFQLDNKLPVNINGKIFIPKGVYHRIIKGSGDLKIKLKKI